MILSLVSQILLYLCAIVLGACSAKIWVEEPWTLFCFFSSSILLFMYFHLKKFLAILTFGFGLVFGILFYTVYMEVPT